MQDSVTTARDQTNRYRLLGFLLLCMNHKINTVYVSFTFSQSIRAIINNMGTSPQDFVNSLLSLSTILCLVENTFFNYIINLIF